MTKSDKTRGLVIIPAGHCSFLASVVLLMTGVVNLWIAYSHSPRIYCAQRLHPAYSDLESKRPTGMSDIFHFLKSFPSIRKGQTDSRHVITFPAVDATISTINISRSSRHGKYIPARPTVTPRGFTDILSMSPLPFLDNFKNPCWKERHTPSNATVLKCLPYFHVIGVCKSGTSDLYFRIQRHPHVTPNSGHQHRETQWWAWRRFGFEQFRLRGTPLDFDWYKQKFDVAATEIIRRRSKTSLGKRDYYPIVTGESSPTTFWDLTGWVHIPQNNPSLREPNYTTPHCLKHLQPRVKLIVLFRDPTERLYSDYLHIYRNTSPADFHRRVGLEIRRFRRCLDHHSLRACIFNRTITARSLVRIYKGLYAEFLLEWWKVFSRKQIFILRTNDYALNLKKRMKEVFSFLDLPPLSNYQMNKIAELPHQNRRRDENMKVGPMFNLTKRILREFYAPYNKKLANLLNDTGFLWRESPNSAIFV